MRPRRVTNKTTARPLYFGVNVQGSNNLENLDIGTWVIIFKTERQTGVNRRAGRRTQWKCLRQRNCRLNGRKQILRLAEQPASYDERTQPKHMYLFIFLMASTLTVYH